MIKVELEKKIKEVQLALTRESAEAKAWSKSKSHHKEASQILVASRQKQLDELLSELEAM